jgi:hypothetical protein
MIFQSRTAPAPAAQSSYRPLAPPLLQGKCACAGTSGPSGECEGCRKKRESGTVRRATDHPLSFTPHRSEVPPIVHEGLHSTGQPVGTTAWSVMEPRFGHDFSQVAVHTKKQSDILPARIKSRLEQQFRQPLDGVRIEAGEEGKSVAERYASIAVSQNSKVHFAPGAYAPDTAPGERVLRHELAHYLQQHASTCAGAGSWPVQFAEAEAECTATKTCGPIRVHARVPAWQPLCMKTYVSTVGGNPYLEKAIQFYQLWENESATRISSYQDIVGDLAPKTDPLSNFRIVAHANGLNLFLPLLTGGKGYADLPSLGLQTRAALAIQFGAIAHLTSDATGTVVGWLKASASGQGLLSKLGLGATVAGIWKEFIWWVVDEHFAGHAKEDPPVSKGPKATSATERAQLVAAVQSAQTAVRAATLSILPSAATALDVDALRMEILAEFKKQAWTWGNEPSGALKERLDRLNNPDVVAFRKEVEAGTFEKNLIAVKARVSDKTYIEIRGCNIGSNDAYLHGIREFFGTKPDRLPSISAPKLYQYFGSPGLLVLPEGSTAPPVADSLKFLFEETYSDATVAADVHKAVKKAGLETVGGLAEVLRHADIKAEFDAWWQMKQKAKGVTATQIKEATLKDFEDFLTTASARTFPTNAPGVGAESLWYLMLLPSTAIDAMLRWVGDQGYKLPAGADPLKTFFGGSRKFGAKTFSEGSKRIIVDWLGDTYPVPTKIYFSEDPEYQNNIRRLP